MWRCIPLLIWLTACGDAPVVDEPVEFAGIIYPADNPTTAAGLELGRRLFFDPILSADSTISCGTCHRPELGFADGRKLAVGLGGRVGIRNSPGLTNIGYQYRSLFWDGRADNLEEQALHPVGDPNEMGGSWRQVIEKLSNRRDYASAFALAFPDRPISKESVGRALGQYQRSLISRDAKYDRVERGEMEYTAQENLGYALFFDLADEPDGPFANLPRGECAHCHTPPHFTNQRFENNGLDSVADLRQFKDRGRGAVTGNIYDNGRFRTPGLRNVALTAPYMHDGRFATLEEVVDHYNSGGHYAENRSPNIAKLGMTADQRVALVSFLQTLTDTSFVRVAGSRVR